MMFVARFFFALAALTSTAAGFSNIHSSRVGFHRTSRYATCYAANPKSLQSSLERPEIQHAFPNISLGNLWKLAASALLVTSLSLTSMAIAPYAAWAGSDTGASSASNAKITTGGASTLQSGRTIAITRGVNLDNSDFSNQNLKGVAFQQSIVRDANFENSNLVGASFFDATVDGSNFDNTDLTQANFEMAQFNRASLKVSSTD
jgi:uncharacterized protein YjbI with pentapeptide repeats